jgi:nucleoside-diphosphate-sugar epimerase
VLVAKNNQSADRRTYVVVGATGKTGREVERHLDGQGHDVRAVARSRGVGIDDTDALDRAFAHADGALVVVPFDLAGAIASGLPPSFADALVETARTFNDGEPWALAPRDDETTTSTSLRDRAHTALAGVSA